MKRKILSYSEIETGGKKRMVYSSFSDGRIKRTYVNGKMVRMVAVLNNGCIILTDKKRHAVLHRNRETGGALYLIGLTDVNERYAGGVIV